MAEEPEDFREFVRSLMTRSDRVLREVVERSDRRFDAWAERFDRRLESFEREMSAMRGDFAEMLAEQRAQREVLFRILDRLPPPENGPAAA